MDIEKLIDSAKHCKEYGPLCDGCPHFKKDNRGCFVDVATKDSIVDIVKYYESLIASERAKVIAEVSAEISKMVVESDKIIYTASDIYILLDSMKPDKGDKE